uniref:DNA replication regulator SLD2 n=1 Tax=Ciona savignyi TaxID=51511 RepID=H2ZP12_CIOSA
MAENSKASLSLMNLKVQIKSWEIAFAKQNGRKPGKSDIALDSTAKTMYIKYAKLKQTKENIPEPREMLTVDKVKPTAAGNVWGASLLKANSLPPDLDDHAPDGEKDPEKEDKKETAVDPLPCVRENLKKNLKQSFSPSMSTVFRKSRQLSETSTHNEKDHIENVSPANNQNADVLKKSHLCLPTNVSFCDPSLTNSLKKPKVFSMFGKRELVNKSVSLSWLNERSDDLSDLINLEKTVKTHNQRNENKTEITSTSTLVETLKITENVTVSVSPYADKSPNSNENTSVKPENTSETCTEFPKYIEIDEVTIPPRPTILNNVSEHVNNDNKTDQDFDEKVESQKNVGKAAQRHSGAKSNALASTNFRRLNMKQKTFSRKGGQGRFLRKQVFRHKLAKKG